MNKAVEANGKTFEYEETKRTNRFVRFEVWIPGVNMNSAIAEFYLVPEFVEDYGQTVSGWDINLPGLPGKDVLSGIARAEGLVA